MEDGRDVSSSYIDDVFSIYDFLYHVKCLMVLLKPTRDVWNFFVYMIMWKSVLFSLVVLALGNCLAIFSTQDDVFILLIMQLFLAAFVGVVNYKTKLLHKCLPDIMNVQVVESVDRDGPNDPLIQEFLLVLKKLDDLIIDANHILDRIFRILAWSFPLVSSIIFVLSVACCILVFYMPIWIFALVVINFIMLYGFCVRFILSSKMEAMPPSNCPSFEQQTYKKESEKSPLASERLRIAEQHFSADDDVAYVEKLIEELSEDMEEEERIDDMRNDDEDFSLHSIPSIGTERPSKHQGNVESEKLSLKNRLLELKNRHQQRKANLGNCIGCNAAFSPLLKRRFHCSHCGNHYCSRCCCYKVPRSLFGATSPAARLETVIVCYFCYKFLTQKPKAS